MLNECLHKAFMRDARNSGARANYCLSLSFILLKRRRWRNGIPEEDARPVLTPRICFSVKHFRGLMHRVHRVGVFF